MDARLRDVLDRWYAGKIARYEVRNTVMEIMTEMNVHDVVEALPREFRGEIADELYAFVDTDPETLFRIWGGSVRPPRDAQEEQERAEEQRRGDIEMRRRFRTITQPTARAWVARHPKPDQQADKDR